MTYVKSRTAPNRSSLDSIDSISNFHSTVRRQVVNNNDDGGEKRSWEIPVHEESNLSTKASVRSTTVDEPLQCNAFSIIHSTFHNNNIIRIVHKRIHLSTHNEANTKTVFDTIGPVRK